MSKTYKITLLPGDGIGPEVIKESVKVIDAIAEKRGFALEYTHRSGDLVLSVSRSVPGSCGFHFSVDLFSGVLNSQGQT